MILKRLKIFHLEYYFQNQKKITISTYGLTLPLLLRGVYDIINSTRADVSRFASDNRAYYDVIMFFVGFVLVTFF